MSDFKVSSIFDVSGLVAVVTGGHTGIGLMITKALAQNGARVYIVGRRGDVLKRSADVHEGDIIDVEGDVTDVESLKKAAAQIAEKEKHLDLVVANSGIGGPSFDGEAKTADAIAEQIMSTSMDEARKLLDTNVLGYFYTSGAFLSLLAKSPNSPQIITVTSNAAYGRRSMAGILYSMTKAATVHMTKMLATHLSETNVRVNSIAPGLYPSELTAGDSDDNNESSVGTMGLPIPLGRAGTGEEMACAILYLASKRQSYSSGSILLTDGGVLANGMPGSY